MAGGFHTHCPSQKSAYLNPSRREGKTFDVGVASSQSSPGHLSHICKSCLMNNVYVSLSAGLKTAWFSVHQAVRARRSSCHSPGLTGDVKIHFLPVIT